MHKMSKESPRVRQENTLRADRLLEHLRFLTREYLHVCMEGSVSMGLTA